MNPLSKLMIISSKPIPKIQQMKTVKYVMAFCGMLLHPCLNELSSQMYVKSNGTVSVGIETPQTDDKFTVVHTAGRGIYCSISGNAVSAIYANTTATTGFNFAVRGLHESTQGAAGFFHANNNDGECAALRGRADGDWYPASCGVAGQHYYTGLGVGSWSYGGDLFAGFSGDYPGGSIRFYVTNSGNVYADGTYNSFKEMMMPGNKKEYRTFNSIVATESWIEDIGSSILEDGEAIVTIDPVFAQAVDLEQGYKVFLTPVSEEMVFLTVSGKSPNEFRVKGMTLDGHSPSCSFDYRIMAKDKDNSKSRMEVVAIPDPVLVPRDE
jgi:hypothetical protein